MKHMSGRIIVGIILLVVAALVSLQVLIPGNIFGQFWEFASTWWPVALVVIGVVGLLSGGSFGFNLVLALAGLWFLADKLDFLPDGMFLPFVLFVIAVLVLVSAFRGRRGGAKPAEGAPGGAPAAPGAGADPSRPAGSTDDTVHVFSAFSGHDARNASQAFRYAEVTAVFGGSSLDLRDARLAPEGARVDLTALFGGADLIVPEGWALSMSSTPIFGGVDNRTSNPAKAEPGQPVLHVNATAIFGGTAVKNRPDRER